MQPGFPHDSAAFARAVDLSALKNRSHPSTAAPPAAPPGGPSAASGASVSSVSSSADGRAGPAGGSVVDVTEATFGSEVIERSRTVPVVIDFWATWCGPCRQLSPVLEKLAVEDGGSWVLAKIDVDANQRIAAAAGVQSIPSVKAVVDGQIVGEFVGALPESQVRQWIDTLLQAVHGQQPADDPVGPPVDQRILDADDALQSGDLDAAEAGYRAVLVEAPADPLASSGLAQVGLLRRAEAITDPAAVIAAADADPTDVAAAARAADVELLAGEPERSFARLVDAVRRTTGAERESARTHLLSLFEVLPPDDTRLARARRDLASVLF